MFIIETDASGYGVGAVLMQKGRPIASYSKILGSRSQHKSIYEKELMVICLAVQKWEKKLRFITQQRELGADFQRWVSKLIGFDFEIQFKPGASNRVADVLSRTKVGEMEFGVTKDDLLVRTNQRFWQRRGNTWVSLRMITRSCIKVDL